jgi:hypothetical protein
MHMMSPALVADLQCFQKPPKTAERQVSPTGLSSLQGCQNPVPSLDSQRLRRRADQFQPLGSLLRGKNLACGEVAGPKLLSPLARRHQASGTLCRTHDVFADLAEIPSVRTDRRQSATEPKHALACMAGDPDASSIPIRSADSRSESSTDASALYTSLFGSADIVLLLC